MNPKSLLPLFVVSSIVLAGCIPIIQSVQTETASAGPISIQTPLVITESFVLSDILSPTRTVTTLVTLEPTAAKETIQPLLKEPMNCAEPCFWGIIPGKTSFDEAKSFFSRLGFTPFEGIDSNSGEYFYTISYDSGTGHDSSLTLHVDNNLVENLVIRPDIPESKEGNPREWVAYSPETLIQKYGSPSRVEFAVTLAQRIGMEMIMYFDQSNLIVQYSGYDMNPWRFCPATAPFDFVRLWIGPNPTDTPSFDTVPLEKATSLTADQFGKLLAKDPEKACFALNFSAFQ